MFKAMFNSNSHILHNSFVQDTRYMNMYPGIKEIDHSSYFGTCFSIKLGLIND